MGIIDGGMGYLQSRVQEIVSEFWDVDFSADNDLGQFLFFS